MKLTSYWLDTSEPFKSDTAAPVQGTCDVAVIGGGLTGSSAALPLAKKDAPVVLPEAETIGHAASGRNGSMCNNGFAQDYGTLSAKLGKKVADRLYRSFEAGVTELNPWKDFAWPAIAGHLGPPWFLPLVGAYYRIKDRFQ
ncbi:FAD-dependent oxidoreductase [Bradyrhizobium sp. 604_D8_N2_3]|uniref:FAD-dependent oxidoreductase n=1 Tax=Bradyrhizobium sp. 604_D8_N2_3 TaxID=3240370 RepID=UPI003F223F56